MIKGVIFDADGTLFDSMNLWENLGETYLRSLGYEPRENLTETFQHMSLYQAACYYRENYGVSLSVDEIMAGVNQKIEAYYREEVALKPGVEGFLKKLQEKKVKMCIATATADYLTEMVLKRWDVEKYFSGLFTCTQVGHGKDEPMIYREAIKHLQTEKAETILFEDALYAIETAKKEGLTTVGVYDAYEKEQTEVIARSDFYLKDFLDFDSFWKWAEKEMT